MKEMNHESMWHNVFLKVKDVVQCGLESLTNGKLLQCVVETLKSIFASHEHMTKVGGFYSRCLVCNYNLITIPYWVLINMKCFLLCKVFEIIYQQFWETKNKILSVGLPYSINLDII
jgi:hypothetical protein